MERIKEAIRLAKHGRDTSHGVVSGGAAAPHFAVSDSAIPAAPAPEQRDIPTLHVNRRHLERNRIIAHSAENPLVSSYDVLRTKVLQAMNQEGWKVLVVTSPTPGCGKTVTATNLALSIARQPEQQAILLDLDLRKPAIAYDLGLQLDVDLATFLRGEAAIEDIMVHLDIAGPQFTVIGNRSSVPSPAEAIASREMKSLIEHLRNLSGGAVIIVDMPPVLVADDVIAFLPQADCCLLTVAEGSSTASEIESAESLLNGTNFLGCVLNKSSERFESYYY